MNVRHNVFKSRHGKPAQSLFQAKASGVAGFWKALLKPGPEPAPCLVLPPPCAPWSRRANLARIADAKAFFRIINDISAVLTERGIRDHRRHSRAARAVVKGVDDDGMAFGAFSGQGIGIPHPGDGSLRALPDAAGLVARKRRLVHGVVVDETKFVLARARSA